MASATGRAVGASSRRRVVGVSAKVDRLNGPWAAASQPLSRRVREDVDYRVLMPPGQTKTTKQKNIETNKLLK